MRPSAGLPVLLIFISVAVCGCATMRYPGAYKVEGKEFKEFKELDDDRALKLVALIYNVKTETWEDGIARSITLEEYLTLLGKRRSRYVKNSGIFDIKYDKVVISKWEDGDLIKLYEALVPKTDAYYMDSAAELTEIQNARRIIYLTALNSIATELKKRENTRSAVAVASQLLLTVLSAALAMI